MSTDDPRPPPSPQATGGAQGARAATGSPSADAGTDPPVAATAQEPWETLGEGEDLPGEGAYRRAIFSVPIDVVVAVGQAQPVIGELLAMRRDTVLPLSSRVDDPVQIMVGDRVIARGELEELGEDGSRLGVRLTEVVDVSDLF
ncbi:MAG: FliM/FliN family flagellar motor switch protein [Pseudomonadota bacterium]